MDISLHRISSPVSPDRALSSVRETDMFYVYQLERDVIREGVATRAAGGSSSNSNGTPITSIPTAASGGSASLDAGPQPRMAAAGHPTSDGASTPAVAGRPEDSPFAVHPTGASGSGAAQGRARGEDSQATAAGVKAILPPRGLEGSSGGRDQRVVVQQPGPNMSDPQGNFVVADIVPERSGGTTGSEGREELKSTQRGSGGVDRLDVGKGQGVAGAGTSTLKRDADQMGGKISVSNAVTSGEASAVAAGDSEATSTQRNQTAPAVPGRQLRTPPHLFAVLHRRLERNDHYLASPFRLEVFGTPLVCRVVPMTGRQLYDKLYRRFSRFLSLKTARGEARGAPPFSQRANGGAQRSHYGQEPPSSHSRESAAHRRGMGLPWEGDAAASGLKGDGGADDNPGDCFPCMGTSEDEECPVSVRATSVWVAAGKVNRWGFR